jgi:hypothetical protein
MYRGSYGDIHQKNPFKNLISPQSPMGLLQHHFWQLADDNHKLHPHPAQVLRNDFYVDGLLNVTSTLEEAIHAREISTLLRTAGFTLRKCEDHSRRTSKRPSIYYHWIMKMVSPHLGYSGIITLTSFRLRAVALTLTHQVLLQLPKVRLYPLSHSSLILLAY